VSSNTYDLFAVSVYEESAMVCIEAGNFAELLKSLTGLVRTLYPELSKDTNNPVLLPHRAEFTSLYLLYFICIATGTKPVSQEQQHTKHTLSAKIANSTLRGNSQEVLRTFAGLPVSLQQDLHIRRAMALQRALLADIDYVAFGRVWRSNEEEERAEKKIGGRMAGEKAFVMDRMFAAREIMKHVSFG
jgi:hypothetical protein